MSWNYHVHTAEEYLDHQFPIKAEEVEAVVGLPSFVSSNITYYLIAAALLLKVLERQKVNDLPAKFILHY